MRTTDHTEVDLAPAPPVGTGRARRVRGLVGTGRARRVRGLVGTGRARRVRGLVGTGCIAALGAVVATTLVAAAAAAAGVDFEVPSGGEAIPVPGIAVVTGFFSVAGVVLAAALLRWSAHPAERFRWTALSLTAISLVPVRGRHRHHGHPGGAPPRGRERDGSVAGAGAGRLPGLTTPRRRGHHRPRCTTSSKGRRLSRSMTASGLSAG